MIANGWDVMVTPLLDHATNLYRFGPLDEYIKLQTVAPFNCRGFYGQLVTYSWTDSYATRADNFVAEYSCKHTLSHEVYSLMNPLAPDSYLSAYTQTLACDLACGKQWITETANQWLGSEHPIIVEFLNRALTEAAEPRVKFDWGLRFEKPASSLTSLMNKLKGSGIRSWMGRRAIHDKYVPWWVKDDQGASALLFATADETLAMVIPNVVKAQKFSALPRVWLTHKARVGDSELSAGTLRRKAHLFGSKTFNEHLESHDTTLRWQRFYGP